MQLRSSRELSDSVNKEASYCVSFPLIHKKKYFLLSRFEHISACERKAESGIEFVPIGLERSEIPKVERKLPDLRSHTPEILLYGIKFVYLPKIFVYG